MCANNRKEKANPHSRTGSTFSIDKDKLIQSMHRISTFLTAPSTVDEISTTLSINEYPYGDGRLSDISYVDEIMTKILDEVIDTLGFDRGIICLLDDEKENLITRVVKNYEPEEAQRAFSVNLNLQKHDSFETRVVKTGQYITLEDSETDPRMTDTDRKITRFYKRGSTFYAPLKMEDEVTGIIAVWTKEKTRLTPEEINILLTFANQVSIIIQTTRLFDNNREKILQLLDLQKAATALNACSVIDEIHEILLKNAVRLGKADKALLYFLDVERNKYLIYDGKEIVVEEADAYSGRIEQGIIRKVLERDAILVQQQTSHYPHMTCLFEEYPSEIAFPLKVRDNFKGVLYLGKKGGAYSQDQINILDILVKNAASSYDNAIMHSLLSLEAKSLKSEVEKLKEREDMLLGFHNILGKSKQMQAIFQIIEEVAKHDTNILIQGESGTGKELIARAIHRQSHRSSKRFVEVNCAAIPGTLLESELFGYEAGAFTDAKKRKTGLLEHASGGTFLLDEVGDMSLPLQAKFLRMLEDGYIRRLGGTENIPVDVRFIFSTNKDLSRMVADGSFREDLFYRIRVVPINIPPLRERQDDISLLARHYVGEFNHKLNKKIKGFNKEAEDILKRYPWPGNVRELKNIIERVMIPQNIGNVLTPANLPAELKATSPLDIVRDIDKALPPMTGGRIDYQGVVDRLNTEVRKRILQKALDRSNGRKAAAARLLGISRYTLIRELKKISKEPG
jgi:two-component system response regulator AtoC